MKPSAMHSFVTPDLWSSNSHELSPVNYIWGIFQQRVYQRKVQDVNDLKQRLIDVWAGVEQSVIDDISYADVSVLVFESE